MSSYSFTLTAPGPTPEAGSGSGAAGYPASAGVRGSIAGWDLRFDPVTFDLVDDGRGAFELTTTASTAVLHALLDHYDEWWGDPSHGSRLHQLDNFIASPGPLIAAECERVLGGLERAGRITGISADAEETQAGRVDVRTAYRDAKSGQPVELTLVPTGG